MARKTVLVRMDKELKEILTTKFPRTKMPDLLNTIYDFSVVRVEVGLKNNGKQKR